MNSIEPTYNGIIKMGIVSSKVLPNFYSFRLYDVNGKVTYRTIVSNDHSFMVDRWDDEYGWFMHVGKF